MVANRTAAHHRPKILLLGTIDAARDEWASLVAAHNAQVITPPPNTTRASFVAQCAAATASSPSIYDGVEVAYRTFASAATTGPLDAELVAALPASLKFICHNGAGYDQIDVAACTARGIRVANVVCATAEATADCALFLMLGALRRFGRGMDTCRRGEWRGKKPKDDDGDDDGDDGEYELQGQDPQGKILGILGMGGIGRCLARKAQAALGMRIRYHNRSRLAEEVEREEAGGAEWVGFDQLLAESDVLSLHLPLNKSTHHLLSTPQFALMKRGIVIINTARGAVMDEAALVDALAAGRVAAAGLDVFEREPEVHPGLLANPNVVLVPHMGTATVQTSRKMERWTMGNVERVLREGKLVNVVPEQRGMGLGDGDGDGGE
ncbi:D-isomer specific 2-hydroxyacid dehydrogenase [Coniella lustricola]|uniref:D-isomer specific 2-hydroxyacid dehydrogenase n=1 Tax=Coniella lustricola TaxID=2025994 RepID=A0A2T2ZTA9_9PEZI|nr:D-isomer specific 2-hydroxyacid dehydrogenase [Coniella lustricola]